MVSDASRAETLSRDAIIGLVLLAVAMLLGLSRCASQQPAAISSPTPSVVPVLAQPDPHGYLYQVSRERYVVPASTRSPVEVQTRLRESWTATDGWTWARQTGTDPAHFIFAPESDWLTTQQAGPDPGAIDKAFRSRIREGERGAGLTHATTAELDANLFDSVYNEMWAGYRPEGALPEDYRRALWDVLAGLPGATVATGVLDSEGRTATRITYLNEQAQPGWTQSIYFDSDYLFLGYTYTIDESQGRGEGSGEHVVINRRIVATIPDDVLSVLGDQREEKQLWRCPDKTSRC